ncbi:MAG: hypothetical protein ACXQT5_02620, partial [Candidatus Syntropharchaeia archaeon]
TEVVRYSKRLERFDLHGKVLITTGDFDIKIEYDHLFRVKPPFGPYPVELEMTYPIGQSEIPEEIDEDGKAVALQNLLKLIETNPEVDFLFIYDERWEHPLLREIEMRIKTIREKLPSSDLRLSSP